jgi:hypothetical protein
MVKWTEEKLRVLSPVERHNLWKNARAKDTDQAKTLVSQIESLDLPYLDPSGLKLDDPAGPEMYKVIFSFEGKTAGVEATLEGLPALAGIEPLIRSALGQQYEKRYEATVQAGYLVALMMDTQGYKRARKKGKMPAGSIAKTAEMFVRRT